MVQKSNNPKNNTQNQGKDSVQNNAAKHDQNAKKPANDSKSIILNKKIADLEAKVADQNDKILRSLAEIENLRRRSTEDVEKASNYAISKFASDLVLVAENFYLAVDNMPKDEIEQSNNLKNFAVGVEMTKNELVKIFEQNGIVRINPIGEKFDHNFHEAMSQVEAQGESGTINKVIQAGYKIKDRLIRPALVEVIQ